MSAEAARDDAIARAIAAEAAREDAAAKKVCVHQLTLLLDGDYLACIFDQIKFLGYS